jgi:hypothetical protein
MINVDESKRIESNCERQSDFLNWLEAKLKKETEKESYKNYYKNEHTKRKRIPRR